MADTEFSVESDETLGSVSSAAFDEIFQDASTARPYENDPFEQQRIWIEDEERRRKERVILNLWVQQETSERRLRKWVAISVFGFLFIEVVVGDGLFYLIGLHKLSYTKWIVQTIYMAMYAQVTSMAFFIVKSLFPKPKTDHLSAVRDMVMNPKSKKSKRKKRNKATK